MTEAASARGWDFGIHPRAGQLLATLAASKPGGRLLELGTGYGLGSAWLLEGMDRGARLWSVDTVVCDLPHVLLGSDPRYRFVHEDAAAFLKRPALEPYDLIFADAPPGKLRDVDLALDAVAVGGIYFADDLDFDAGPERASALEHLQNRLAARPDFVVSRAEGGVLVAVRRSPQGSME